MLRRAIASASRAAAPVQRRFASTAAQAENAATKEASFMDKLPKHPDYQGVEAVVRYYLPHSGQVRAEFPLNTTFTFLDFGPTLHFNRSLWPSLDCMVF